MCLSKTIYKIVLLVPLFVKILTLEVLPVENTIFKTESAVRNITNEIFLGLDLKGIKNNDKLKQHSLIHNFFTKLTLKDQHTLAAIATLSRPDKNSISNKTKGYIDILNELQQEDSINHDENAITNNINVINFVDHFLSQSNYENNSKGLSNFEEILDMLQSDIEDSNSTDYSNEAMNDPKVLSDHEFWEPEVSGRRIFRGDRTKIKYFPFMASIQIFQSFQCGGSIIKSDLVITAASCLQLAYNNRFFRENPAFLSVRVGSNFYQGGGENIAVLEVYFHPSYDPKTLKDNLSILRLVRRINLRTKKGHKARVKKIDIDRLESPLPANTPGIIIVGWGARKTSNILENPWTNRLAFSNLDYYSWHDCREVYSRDYVTHRNFCAGYISKGSGACNKDAGDPGVVKGLLTGVVSFGTPVCGTPDAPTVFTKIGFYADWIDEIMEMEVPNWKRKTTHEPPPREPITSWISTRETFKIQPIGRSKQKPVPIQEVDALRMLNADTELKSLLENMLTDDDDKLLINDELSQLRQATEEIVYEEEVQTQANTHKIKPKQTKATTRLMTLDPIREIKKYTVLDPNLLEEKLDEDSEVDKNIVNIINNLQSDSAENVEDNVSSDVGVTKPKKKVIKVQDDVSSDVDVTKHRKKVTKHRKKVTKHRKKVTKVQDDVSSDVDETKPPKKVTKVKDDVSSDVDKTKPKKQVTKMQDDDSSDVDETKPNKKVTKKVTKKETKKVTKKLNYKAVRGSDHKLGNTLEDSILTLLYLSDQEKENGDNELLDIGKGEEGLSIATDEFKDFTYRQGNESKPLYDGLPKDEWYDLLSEAIEEVAKDATNKQG